MQDSASDEVDFGQSLRALKTPEEFTQATASSRPVVVEFFAPWCALADRPLRMPPRKGIS